MSLIFSLELSSYLMHKKLLSYPHNLQEKELIKAMDQMQLSVIQEGNSDKYVYMRSSISDIQERLIKRLNLRVPKDVTAEAIIKQYFN